MKLDLCCHLISGAGNAGVLELLHSGQHYHFQEKFFFWFDSLQKGTCSVGFSFSCGPSGVIEDLHVCLDFWKKKQNKDIVWLDGLMGGWMKVEETEEDLN